MAEALIVAGATALTVAGFLVAAAAGFAVFGFSAIGLGVWRIRRIES